jgi:cytoskeletal protein CcmA (bactofilin family)
VSDTRGVLVVGPDLVIKGHVRNCQRVEIHGYVEGEVLAKELHIHRGGRLFGRARSETAVVDGTLKGDVHVKDLVSIGSTGDVTGNVRYGKLALEVGGNLSAEVRKVPPELAGDLELSVARGQSVRVTLEDLNAIDPDNTAQELVFRIDRLRHGIIMLTDAPGVSVTTFTLADLQAGRVAFQHDGSASSVGSFEVLVTDAAGATSGAAQTVHVTIG